MKKCSKCGIEKSVVEFYKSKVNKDGLCGYCKKCSSLKAKTYYLENSEIISKRTSEWGKNNKQKRVESSRKWIKKNKDKRKNIILKYDFGISLDNYNSLLKKQNNVCAICFSSETKLNRNKETSPLSVDHCHKTGKIRGLLCHRCNVAIGFLKADEGTTFLLNAIRYIKKANKI